MVLTCLDNPDYIKSQAEERGLSAAIAGRGAGVSLILGWNSDAVQRKFEMFVDAVESVEVVEGAVKRELTWKENLLLHEEFKKHVQLDASDFRLANAVGSYVVECQSLHQEPWSDKRTMTLDIRELLFDGLAASFHWGALEGLMLLATDHESLESLVAEAEQGETLENPNPSGWSPRHPASEPVDDPEFEPVDDSGLEPVDYPVTTATTSEPTTPEVQESPEAPIAPLKRKASSPLPSSKKPKPASGLPPHLELAWRGYITSERREQLGSDQERRGRIEFPDARCLNFMGRINVPTLGWDAEFSGFKVSDKPTPSGRQWNDVERTGVQPSKTIRVDRLQRAREVVEDTPMGGVEE